MQIFKATLHDEQEESHWLSISDLMAGLMIVFLFIAIALMRSAYIERDKIKEVAVAYQENQVAIFEALSSEFDKDLASWNAHIDESSLTFTFKSPDVLFKSGSAELKIEYQDLLIDFFPRYMNAILPFRQSINEIRIEGHTSSFWGASTNDEAYFNNMRLSQERTRSVLQFVYSLPRVLNERPWMKSYIAAVGLSSSKLIFDSHGKEDSKSSRRVSFRVITNADIQIKSILQDGV